MGMLHVWTSARKQLQAKEKSMQRAHQFPAAAERLRCELIDCGVQPDKIAYLSMEASRAERDYLDREFSAGNVLIVIGSEVRFNDNDPTITGLKSYFAPQIESLMTELVMSIPGSNHSSSADLPLSA